MSAQPDIFDMENLRHAAALQAVERVRATCEGRNPMTDQDTNHDSRQLSIEELERLDDQTIAETVWEGDERKVIRGRAFDSRKKLAA